MNWISSKDKLPNEGEDVLIYIDKEFKFAVFSRNNGGFKLYDNNFLWIEKQAVWWTPLTPP